MRRGLLAALTVSALLVTSCSGGEGTVGDATTTESTATSGSAVPGPTGSDTDQTTQTGGGGDGAGATDGSDTGQITAGPGEDAATTAPSGDRGIGLPSVAEVDRARADVAALSDRELAGQLIVAAYSGTDPAEAAALVREQHLGGLITLGGNVPGSIDARVPLLTSMTSQVQQAVTDSGRDWPAFLGIDQEGGAITRVAAPLDRWPAPMALGAARDPELVREVTAASGEQLRALGYTVVFAPSADVTIGPQDPTIGTRSPGSDPQLVAETAVAEATGFADAGIVAVVKHFPGHGGVTGDSHLGAVVLDRDLSELEEQDLVPFRATVDAGVPALMPGHIVVSAVDPDAPATLSRAVLTDLLREDLGFTGMVVTDALNMGAVTDAGGGHPAVGSLLAGADVLLMPPDPPAAIDAIVFALEDGILQRADLEDSAARTVATLRHQQQVPAPDLSVIGSDRELSVRAAAAGVTQLSGTCGERLVGDSITIQGGTEADRANLVAAAGAAGLATGSGDSVVLVGGSSYQAGGGVGGPGTGSGDVVVAMDRPYVLADSTASTALIAAYGRDRATMDALVQVLLGEATAPGALPTPVGEFPIGSGCSS